MEAFSLSQSLTILYYLGLPGLIFIIWHFDNKRFQRQEDARKKDLDKILKHYREDVSEIRRLYESNARLVESTALAFKRLEKLYGEAISVISLNTQTQTHLQDAIENNRFCPMVREATR